MRISTGRDMESKDSGVGRNYSPEEVLGPITPGRLLRGARNREGLTQKALAESFGIRPHHISEMESGKRPIGRKMAERLAQELNTNYKRFL